MKVRGVFFLSWFGIRGIVLYPFIFFSPQKPDAELVQHEFIHWQQIKTIGFVPFYFHYLREYFHGRRRGLSHHQAYREISFEKEAYTHQHQDHYLVNRDSTKNYRSAT